MSTQLTKSEAGDLSADSLSGFNSGTVRRILRYFPLGLLPFLFGAVIWLLLSASESRRLQLIVPDASSTLAALAADVQTGTMWRHGWITLQEIILAFIVALVISVVVGSFLSVSRLALRIFWPSIIFSQSLPKVALAPLLVTWFGFGLQSKVALAALIAFFPMLIGVVSGLSATRDEELDLMRSLGSTRWHILLQVQIPRALPSFFGGLEIGFVLSIIGAIMSEMVGARGGLGYLVLFRATQLDLEGMFSPLIALSLLGAFADMGIRKLHQRLIFWEGY